VQSPFHLLARGTTQIGLMKLDVMRPTILVDASREGLRLWALVPKAEAAVRDLPIRIEKLFEPQSEPGSSKLGHPGAA
jgi:hypothetical protein